MRKIHFLVAVAGIISLYFIPLLSQPERIAISEVWKYNGKDVIVEGEVKNVVGDIITIGDGNATTLIYMEKMEGIEYGDYIRVEGRVGEYGNDFAIYARKTIILEKWDKESISLPYLAENYERFVNKNVNVTGYIYSKYNGYFYLTDEYMDYKIMVYCNHSIPFARYEKVMVKALMLYDSGNLRFYLKICRDSHGVWSYE